MCNGTGSYYSKFWWTDMPCWGCAGCWFSNWVSMWQNLGRAVQK